MPAIMNGRTRRTTKKSDGNFTVDEVADKLRVSRMTVYRLMDAKSLKYVEVSPRRRRVTQEQLDAYMQKNTKN